MLSTPQGAWCGHGGGQAVLEDPRPHTHPMLTHPSSQNQSPILYPPALGSPAPESRVLLERPTHSGFWGFNDGKDSPDVASTPPHPGPARLRPGLSLWAIATSLSRQAPRGRGSSREWGRGQAGKALLPLPDLSELHSRLPASGLSRAAPSLPDVLHTVPPPRAPKKIGGEGPGGEGKTQI